MTSRTTRASTSRAARPARSTTTATSRKKGPFIDPDDDSEVEVIAIESSSEDEVPAPKRRKKNKKSARSSSPSSFIDDRSAGDSGDSYIDAVEAEKTALKKKLKRTNDALKRKEKEVKDREKDEKRAARLAKKMEYKEGQRISLLDLPNEIIERCFSLDHGILQLGDFLALNWTCRTFRDATDDVSWEGVYMKAGPGKKGTVTDRWSLSTVAGEDTSMMVGMHEVSLNRAAYCRGVLEGRPSHHRYRAFQFGVKANPSAQTGPSPFERLATLVDEQNDLILRYVPPAGPFHSPARVWNPFMGQYEADALHMIKHAEAMTTHNAKKVLYSRYLETCSRVLLQKLPLTRGESKSIVGGERNALTRVRQRDIGPWEVICLRAYNFPLTALSELTLKTFLSAAEITQVINPVPEDLFVRSARTPLAQSGEHFYAKDADRLILARLGLIKAKEARVRAERNALAAKGELEAALQAAETTKQRKKLLKSKGEYECWVCGDGHPLGHGPEEFHEDEMTMSDWVWSD